MMAGILSEMERSSVTTGSESSRMSASSPVRVQSTMPATLLDLSISIYSISLLRSRLEVHTMIL